MDYLLTVPSGISGVDTFDDSVARTFVVGDNPVNHGMGKQARMIAVFQDIGGGELQEQDFEVRVDSADPTNKIIVNSLEANNNFYVSIIGW